jgi:hypothetical protein
MPNAAVQLFIDKDGVLADFDRHHEAVFGARACKIADNVDWGAVRAVRNFYLGIPPMADLGALWARIEHHKPIVLTGIPSSVAEAADNKRAWARRHLGAHVEVRCCLAREKCLHASPGDILIDDWDKHRDLWIKAGGRWITHISAADTARQLTELGF